MSNITAYFIIIIFSYFLGSIPFGYLLVKLVKGIDIRTQGSGNIGATNVGRVLGWPGGVLVFLLDVGKGFGAVFLIPLSVRIGLIPGLTQNFSFDITILDYKELSYMILCGAAVIIGHMFPVYLKFKGGKGVATGLGVFLALIPAATGLTIGIWALIFLLFRYVSLASILAAVSLPIILIVINRTFFGHPVFIFAVICSALIVVKHIPNIKRLVSGVEPKIGKKINA